MPVQSHHDFAILRLKYFHPTGEKQVLLAADEHFAQPGMILTLAGMGRIHPDAPVFPKTPVLAQLRILQHCVSADPNVDLYGSLCSESAAMPRTGSCHADSGGPVVVSYCNKIVL